MFEMRTDSRNASLTSPFVTRPHHSNLYGRIERFVRFLRAGHAPAGTSLSMVTVNCARGLRPWIAPVESARGTWRRAWQCGAGLDEARVNYAPAHPANRSPTLRLVMWSGHIGISANLTISH